MAFVDLVVTVLGEPSVWVGVGEKGWKDRAFAACREKFVAYGYSKPVEEDCAVEMDFHVSDPRLYEIDLDNLLKPAIDGLGMAIFRSGNTGEQFDSEDFWIKRIVAQKLATDGNPRLEISVMPWEER